MTVFRDWAFKTAPYLGGATPPTARTMPDRLAEVINVKDYLPIGQPDGTTDNTAGIQAAFNAAFGTSGAPHGIANANLNRPVYFPPGYYACSNLLLTQVYGGRIYGGGQSAVRLHYNGSGTSGIPLIRTDSCAYTTIENMTIGCTGRPDDTDLTTNTICLDLNCGSGGFLNNIGIINCSFGAAWMGIRVAESGIDGAAVSFIHTTLGGARYGIKLNSPDGLINVVGGGLAECNYGVWVKQGSCVETGASNSGIYNAGVFTGQTDVLHESNGVTTMVGGRSESQNLIYITNANGQVNVSGTLHNQYNLGAGGLGPRTVDGTAGKVSLNGVFLGADGQPNSGIITGAVNVSLRNVRWGFDENHFPSFTGKVVNYIPHTPLTFATLPPNPADGLMISISDANLSGPKLWGDNITAGGSTNHALLRWNNGTSNWTLVGK